MKGIEGWNGGGAGEGREGGRESGQVGEGLENGGNCRAGEGREEEAIQ